MINYWATRNLLGHPDLQSWVPGWVTGKKFLNHRLPQTAASHSIEPAVTGCRIFKSSKNFDRMYAK